MLENELYEPMRGWLEQYLNDKYKGYDIIAVDTSQERLDRALSRYGIVKERVSALMTDALRANLLEVLGYKTQLLEFIDISHSPKNILIRASKSNISKEKKDRALKEVNDLIKEFNFNPTLYNLLKEDNLI